jgi:hypothetical protein
METGREVAISYTISEDVAPEARVACLKAVRYLTDQQDGGAWLYDASHPVRYVWCVSQCVLALKGWRDERVQNSVQNLPALTGKAGLYLGDAAVTLWETVRANFIYFAISALFAIQFRNGIVHIARSLTSWLSLSRVDIINNLASSLVWVAITVIGGLIVSRIMTRGSRSSHH